MTIEEIFTNLTSHMREGVNFHKELSEYYLFLGLPGYGACHEYHCMEEMRTYYNLCKFYICHMNRLLPDKSTESNDVIPSNWYKYYRQDVDINTIRSSVRAGLEKWIEWETETKKLYE